MVVVLSGSWETLWSCGHGLHDRYHVNFLQITDQVITYRTTLDLPYNIGLFKMSLGAVWTLFENKYFIDEAYSTAVINPLVNASKNLWYYVDVKVIDKATYTVTDIVRGCGSFVRSLQNGNMQQYAMYVVIGVVVALSYMLMG